MYCNYSILLSPWYSIKKSQTSCIYILIFKTDKHKHNWKRKVKYDINNRLNFELSLECSSRVYCRVQYWNITENCPRWELGR